MNIFRKAAYLFSLPVVFWREDYRQVEASRSL